MGNRTVQLLRAGILLVATIVVLLGVGWWLQRTETLPDAATPVVPTAGATSTVPGTTGTPGSPTAPPASDGGRDPKTPPTGYAQSCASAFPWGQQVSRPFVCIDSPKPGATVEPTFRLEGYAAGAFENTLVVSIVAQMDGGMRIPATGDIRVPVTATAPDLGMPGPWQLNVNLGGVPEGAGKLRIEVFAESPQDGSRMIEATLDLRLQR